MSFKQLHPTALSCKAINGTELSLEHYPMPISEPGPLPPTGTARSHTMRLYHPDVAGPQQRLQFCNCTVRPRDHKSLHARCFASAVRPT